MATKESRPQYQVSRGRSKLLYLNASSRTSRNVPSTKVGKLSGATMKTFTILSKDTLHVRMTESLRSHIRANSCSFGTIETLTSPGEQISR